MSGAVEGQSPPGRRSSSASRGQGDIAQDLMPFTTSPPLLPPVLSPPVPSPPPLTPSSDPMPVLRASTLHTLSCVFNVHRRTSLHPLYGAFPHTSGQSLFTEGRLGSSSRKNSDLLPARVSADAGFRAASVKLMSQPSIKEALTSLNYTWSEIKYAGLFERNNATAGWHGHVIFSVLLERRANVSQPHLELFLSRRISERDPTVCLWCVCVHRQCVYIKTSLCFCSY